MNSSLHINPVINIHAPEPYPSFPTYRLTMRYQPSRSLLSGELSLFLSFFVDDCPILAVDDDGRLGSGLRSVSSEDDVIGLPRMILDSDDAGCGLALVPGRISDDPRAWG